MTLLAPFIIGIVMFIVDQLTKYGILQLFEGRIEDIPLINGVLSLYHVNNDGAGFSIFSGQTTFLIILTTAFIIFITYLLLARKFESKLTDYAFCLVLSGGIGNLIDRIFRNGQVVDFIKTDFIDFPIFNVADICITIGAGLLILYFILDMIKEMKEKKEQNINGKS